MNAAMTNATVTVSAASTGSPVLSGAALRSCGSSLTAAPVTDARLRRAPEAFTAPFQGTGLPIAARVDLVVAAPVVATDQQAAPATGSAAPAYGPARFHNSTHVPGTTLGIHSSRRPAS